MAYLSWRYVELPFRDSQRVGRKTIIKLSVVVSLALILFGVIGHLSNGFLYRYAPEDRALASIDSYKEGLYVSKRFDEKLLAPFNSLDDRRKILIIGDSYAQDLVNALYESSMGENMQVSTRHISHLCGNLFIAEGGLPKQAVERIDQKCKGAGIYEDEALKKIMLDADEIWFASKWQAWQTAFIRQSISNVKKISNKPVKVFGTKDFGSINLKELLVLSGPERINLVQKIDPDVININAEIRKNLSSDEFVDSQNLICSTQESVCHLFNADGQLLSFDGWHLTKAGAKYFGIRLKNKDLIDAFKAKSAD
nr:SGNH hydrolase domain-containing protein [Polynucleobacter sp. AP-Kaivos-20-H2]